MALSQVTHSPNNYLAQSQSSDWAKVRVTDGHGAELYTR